MTDQPPYRRPFAIQVEAEMLPSTDTQGSAETGRTRAWVEVPIPLWVVTAIDVLRRVALALARLG